MTNTLQQYFPMIRTREAILSDIQDSPGLMSLFHSWKTERQEEFLNFCSGTRGIKLLYDSFFKEALNPEYDSSRLESFLGEALHRKVKILTVLPNDSTRIADESSLLVTDIIVQLEDGSLANIEVQKIGYSFPGARAACYSADMLLRQYKRVRQNKGTDFSYRDIQNVYLIVLYEKSPKIFHTMPDTYFHHACQVFDSGLKLNLLQEFILIPLDIFAERMHNKSITNHLEAWLTCLSTDNPERIVELITHYPEFKAIYEDLYNMCRNTEKVMEMFSEELAILDRNTVKLMIEEQMEEIEAYKKELAQKDSALTEKDSIIEKQAALIAQLQAEKAEK